MFEKISRLKENFKEQLEKAQSAGEVEELRVSFLGKSGSVTGLLKSMGGLSPEDRKTVPATRWRAWRPSAGSA